MKKKQKSGMMLLIGGIALALIATILTVSYLRMYTTETEVVMTTTEIGPYEQIESRHITTVEVPMAGVPDNAVTSPEQVIGEYSQVGILPSTILRGEHFAEDIVGSPLAHELTHTEERDSRVMALPHDLSLTLGNRVGKNDHIDLVFFMEKGDGGLSKVVMRNLRVMDVVGGDDAQSVLISVTPKEAEAIIYGLNVGSPYALLNPYDADPIDALTEEPVSTDSFLDEFFYPDAMRIQQEIRDAVTPDEDPESLDCILEEADLEDPEDLMDMLGYSNLVDMKIGFNLIPAFPDDVEELKEALDVTEIEDVLDRLDIESEEDLEAYFDIELEDDEEDEDDDDEDDDEEDEEEEEDEEDDENDDDYSF